MDFAPDVFLKDGDSLGRYGISAKVIGLPGHTKGSIGIDCGEAGVIVGDALMNMFYPTVSMLYGDRNTMLQSAEKLQGLGASQCILVMENLFKTGGGGSQRIYLL